LYFWEEAMKFLKLCKNFHRSEDGAVTVDWVVLTAAVVGLSISAFAAVRGGTGALSSTLNSYMSNATINTAAL
jgi:hypothetical protein